MELRRLGRSGLKVSAVGLGGNTFGRTVDGDAAIRVIHCALDAGITFIDTSDVYSAGKSEELLGQALKGRRDEVVLATKVRHPMGKNPMQQGLSRHWIMRAIEDSLRRLQTDYVDLYQAHAPDEDTPLEETLRVMDDLVRQGKVRYVGASNYAAWEMARAAGISEREGLAPWISAQNRWNILEGIDDPTLLPACRELGIGIIPYTPLASGILTGKYRAGEPPPADSKAAVVPSVRERLTDQLLKPVERLKPWAEARGHTTGDLGVAWLLAHDVVSTVIVGARSEAQVRENVKAGEWRLSPEERDDAASLARG